MKKYSLTKKANYRRILLIRRTVLLLGGLIMLWVLFLVAPYIFRGVTAAFWYPFDSVRTWIEESGSSLPQYLRDRSALLSELEALKVRVATEQGNSNTLQKLQVENNEFRTQIGAVPEARVLARVVGRPNQLPYDMLMIDRGSNHAVVQNAPVFLGSDQVIGFVSKVFEKTSLVTLVTTPGFISSAYVIGPDIYTFAEGVGGGVLRVRIPQGILLQTGDLVVLPALDSGVYGDVSLVEAAPTQPEQYGYVSADIPLQSLYYVSVGAEPVVTHTFEQAEKVVADAKSALFTVAVPSNILVTPEHASTSYVGTSTILTPRISTDNNRPVSAPVSSSTR
jgi:cell shape-determining protein MreC